jgi:hypothetical protein
LLQFCKILIEFRVLTRNFGNSGPAGAIMRARAAPQPTQHAKSLRPRLTRSREVRSE